MPTPKQHEALWKAAERELGSPIPGAVCAYLEQRGCVDLDAAPDRDTALADLLCELRHLQAAGCWPTPTREAVELVPPGEDERWPLLYDLGRRFEALYDDLPPIDGFHGFRPMTIEQFPDNASYPPSRRIRVEFDARMSMSMVVAILRREWSQRLRPKGWVRSTRAMGKRAVKLLRFVCLESPREASWRERMAAWNERYPQWGYRDVRAFTSAFHRAEAQLSGARFGLLRLYVTREEYERRDQRWREAEQARIARYYEVLDAFPQADRHDIEWALHNHPEASLEELEEAIEELAQQRREEKRLLEEGP